MSLWSRSVASLSGRQRLSPWRRGFQQPMHNGNRSRCRCRQENVLPRGSARSRRSLPGPQIGGSRVCGCPIRRTSSCEYVADGLHGRAPGLPPDSVKRCQAESAMIAHTGKAEFENRRHGPAYQAGPFRDLTRLTPIEDEWRRPPVRPERSLRARRLRPKTASGSRPAAVRRTSACRRRRTPPRRASGNRRMPAGLRPTAKASYRDLRTTSFFGRLSCAVLNSEKLWLTKFTAPEIWPRYSSSSGVRAASTSWIGRSCGAVSNWQ